ncbi:MAG: hypothetical protein JO080_10915 [Mucilaginibacter sp.]|nr:hypothetical protein [Mucilaginibacter sp.]
MAISDNIDLEDFLIAEAIMEGETGEIIDMSEFLKSVEKSITKGQKAAHT